MDIVEFEPVVKRISVLAASAFAASLYRWFEQLPSREVVATVAPGTHPQAVHTPMFHPIMALAIVLTLAAVVHSLTEFLLYRLPMRFRPVRRLIYPTASIEGYWLQLVHAVENPYSIVCVEYDTTTSSYKYHGTNYLHDRTVNAHFESVQTSVHESGSGLTFNFDAAVHRRNPDLSAVKTDAARGYGKICFTTETGKGFVLGRGEFFETNPTPNWRTFEMYKIPTSAIAEAWGKRKHALDDLDYRSLLLQTLLERQQKQNNLDESSVRLSNAHLNAQEALGNGESVPPALKGDTA